VLNRTAFLEKSAMLTVQNASTGSFLFCLMLTFVQADENGTKKFAWVA